MALFDHAHPDIKDAKMDAEVLMAWKELDGYAKALSEQAHRVWNGETTPLPGSTETPKESICRLVRQVGDIKNFPVGSGDCPPEGQPDPCRTAAA